MMCPLSNFGDVSSIWCFGITVFLLVWIVFVPIVITARLERIIKLLKERE